MNLGAMRMQGDFYTYLIAWTNNQEHVNNYPIEFWMLSSYETTCRDNYVNMLNYNT